MSAEAAVIRDLRTIVEAMLVVVHTHLLLGWELGTAITQADGTVLAIPMLESTLHAGADWTDHLYRFGVIGGSKMHEFSGTTPLAQLCAALGISTTLAANLHTWFVQVAIAVFSILAIEALAGRRLAAHERVISVWLTACAPVLGWRLGVGHENLLFGLLPFLATTSLLLVARERMPSVVALVLAAFAIATGVSGLGTQSVLYSVVFGAPIAFAIARPSWRTAAVLAVALGGVCIVLPRLVPMIAHAVGDDASRALGDSVADSYGAMTVGDWLASIPWLASGDHERNYPLGPLVVPAIALWPRAVPRRLGFAAIASVIAVVVFAALLANAIPLLSAFRVPARAILSVLLVVPILGLAALWSRTAETSARRGWLAVAIAAVVIVGGAHVPALARELVAWLACGALVVLVRRRAPDATTAEAATVGARGAAYAGVLAAIAGLGVVAFGDRFPAAPRDVVEGGPAQVRAAVLAQAPEVAMPLARVQIADPPPPFDMSLAWAARLPSLDGVWYPPRRFLDLLGALRRRPAPPTMCVFALSKSPAFPALQQLYNIGHGVVLARGAIEQLPDTPGPAWFPTELATVASPPAMADAVWAGRADLRATIARTGWLLATDALPPIVTALDPALPGCTEARVLSARTDELGQRATFRVSSPASCVLVIATNYVTTLRAHQLPVFPIDVALTGVVVPAGTTTVELYPEVDIAWWSRLLQLLGVAGAIVTVLRARRAPAVRVSDR